MSASSASLGVNLRITSKSNEGGRKYMEDYFSIAYQRTDDDKDLEFAYIGIFDGHGGSEAALFAKDNLMEFIIQQKIFWSDRDEDVLKAIREGFIATHMAMLKEQEKWPKTASGLPSTAGTTASIAFIRRGRIFTGHVGDSGIILGYQNPGSPHWEARRLTRDHKPESRTELQRIEQSGGKVVAKSGVPRVVWYRPQIGHKGPITRSTPMDEIPFLAVARSLGDLWSYNSANNEFVVSPEPDTNVIPIDTSTYRCLIFGTDGLWNMISPSTAVSIIQAVEQHNLSAMNDNPREKSWTNPSDTLVNQALERWANTRMRADNTTALTLLLDPPGPPGSSRDLRNPQKAHQQQGMNYVLSEDPMQLNMGTSECHTEDITASQEFCERAMVENPYPASGLEILTRYADEQPQGSSMGPKPNFDKPQYTEEFLDRLHEEFYSSISCEENYFVENPEPAPTNLENIQINVVSSSSDNTKKSKMKKCTNKKSSKHQQTEPDIPSTSNFPTGVLTSTKSLSSEVNKTNKSKLKTNLSDVSDNKPSERLLEPPDIYLERALKGSSRLSDNVESTRSLRSQRNENSANKKCDKQSERRCKSLGPSEIDNEKFLKNSRLSDSIENTRFLRSQTNENTSNKKSDSDRSKRSKSVGPSHRNIDLEHPTPVQNQNCLKNIDNNVDQQQKSRSLGPKESLQTKTTRSSIKSNQSLLVSPQNFNNEVYNNSRLKRSQSLGPRDLIANVKNQNKVKNNVKTKITRDKSNDNIVINKNELSTKNNNDKCDHFSLKSPRTRSQGLIGISNSDNRRKQKSNVLQHDVSNFEHEERRSRSLGPKDLLNIPSNSNSDGVKTRSCQTPYRLKSQQNLRSKRDRIIDSDEENVVINEPKMKRSRSLGPLEFPIKDLGIKKSRGRPPKRERNESDEENNILSAPKFKRSRSLGPRDLRSRDTFIERNNLREKNVLLERSKGETLHDVTIPNTRSQRNRRLPT